MAKYIFIFLYAICSSILNLALATYKCNEYKPNNASLVCVCDEKFCDYYKVNYPKDGQYMAVASNKAGLRFLTYYGKVKQSDYGHSQKCEDIISKKSIVLNINRDIQYQNILGFGGSFTDTAGFNLAQLSDKLREHVFRSYFTKEGLNYNMGRVPIGHSDFSLYEYYLNDVKYDDQMEHFALAEPEYKYKLPYIKKAKAMTEDNLLLTSSIWSPPIWMKEKDESGNLTIIKEEYYSAFARYIVKFLKAYKEEGVDIWTVAAANEPLFNIITPLMTQPTKNAITWPLEKLAKFCANFLRPMLIDEGLSNTEVLSLDENRFSIILPWLSVYLNTEGIDDSLKYIGVHGYFDKYISVTTLDELHKRKPNATIVMTEFSNGVGVGVELGSWDSVESYINVLIGGLNHWTSGFIDWNLILDTKGGPSYVNSVIDGLIIADAKNKRILKQPTYYAFGHFSKFIPRGSKRIDINANFSTDIQYTAVITPDGFVTVIIYNHYDYAIVAEIRDHQSGEFEVKVSPKTIMTLVY